MNHSEPKFKIGDKVKYHTGTKIGIVKRIIYLPSSSEPCYEVEGFEVATPEGTLPSLEAESILELAD